MSLTLSAAVRIADDVGALVRSATTHEGVATLVPVTVRVPLPRTDGRLWGDVPVGDRWPATPHTERWERVATTHSVTHAPLLDQLRAALTGSTVGDDVARGVPASKPSARLDAIAAYDRINRESTLWAQQLGSRVRVPLPDRLRGLVGAATTADPDLIDGDHGLARVARGWVITARIVTGWDRPPYTPNVPCPNSECEQRGTIRVRLDQRIGSCTACGTFWDQHDVERLGEYVRWAGEHLTGPRHWLTDADGYPVECMECLQARRVMAERQVARVQATRDRDRLVGAVC